MDKIFNVYLYKADAPDSAAYANLELPAMPYELMDVLDKLRLNDGERMCCEIVEYKNFEYLFSPLDGALTLYEANALAQKLSQLDEYQRTVFEGLVKMEGTNAAISPQRIIDLAYSTDCCHVICEATNDKELGRFFAENGFVPGAEQLSDEFFEMLDFERIGRTFRQDGSGAFTSGGYVVKLSDWLNEAYAALDLTPVQPDYTILLEVSKGFFNDPEYDSDKTVQLKLPAGPEALDAALTALDVWDWREAGWRCLDCRVPSLTQAASDAQDIQEVNDLARTLESLPTEKLPAYKALLEAVDCQDIQSAQRLADTLDGYTFSPQLSSPAEAAKEELSRLMPEDKAEHLIPHLNLYRYGQEIMRNSNGQLTSYGMIERTDQQPIQTMDEQSSPDRLPFSQDMTMQ